MGGQKVLETRGCPSIAELGDEAKRCYLMNETQTPQPQLPAEHTGKICLKVYWQKLRFLLLFFLNNHDIYSLDIKISLSILRA